jgi:hypothetical protein
MALDLGEIRGDLPILGGRGLVRERTEALDESFVLREHGCCGTLHPRQPELELELVNDSERGLGRPRLRSHPMYSIRSRRVWEAADHTSAGADGSVAA